MALAFPSLPGIRPIRGFGDGVPQRDQGRVKQKSATTVVIGDEDIHVWPLETGSGVHKTYRPGKFRLVHRCRDRLARRGDELLCNRASPKEILRTGYTLHDYAWPPGMSMPRQVPGWPRKCSPKTRINYEGVQSALTQLVQKPQSSDS